MYEKLLQGTNSKNYIIMMADTIFQTVQPIMIAMPQA